MCNIEHQQQMEQINKALGWLEILNEITIKFSDCDGNIRVSKSEWLELNDHYNKLAKKITADK